MAVKKKKTVKPRRAGAVGVPTKASRKRGKLVSTKAAKPVRQAPSLRKAPAGKQSKPIGVVTHYFTAIKVAIIKFKLPVKAGQTIALRGSTTDFTQKIASIQYDHKPIPAAPKGKEVGIKVGKRVREGDEAFLV